MDLAVEISEVDRGHGDQAGFTEIVVDSGFPWRPRVKEQEENSCGGLLRVCVCSRARGSAVGEESLGRGWG